MQEIKKIVVFIVTSFVFVVFSVGCHKEKKTLPSEDTSHGEEEMHTATSLFSADSTFSFLETQVSFGPRVPNSTPHFTCGNWLIKKLSSYGAELSIQQVIVDTHQGTKLPIRNIIASFNRDKPNRILLLAHWDTRPIADNDPTPSLQKKPILGADDGASGVAILLEIARLMHFSDSKAPIDILLVDAEDMGQSNVEESWCIGSTYWSKNPHTVNYHADFGILLDMVGAKGARFKWEYFSKTYAPGVITDVWMKAIELGHGKYFVKADGGALTDDHLPIIKNLGIPTVNIVNYDPQRDSGFGKHWHTHADNLEIIDKEVLYAVGSTVWEVINER